MKIKNSLVELRNATVGLRLHYDIWITLVGEEGHNFIKQQNKAPLFFQVTAHANLISICVTLYRIYETRPDTINIPCLIKVLKSEHKEGDKHISLAKELLENAKPIWIKIGMLRNQVYGHRNASLSLDDIYKNAEIKPNNILELIRITEKLLNHLSLLVNKSTHAFNLSGKSDTITVLQIMKKRKKGRDVKPLPF